MGALTPTGNAFNWQWHGAAMMNYNCAGDSPLASARGPCRRRSDTARSIHPRGWENVGQPRHMTRSAPSLSIVVPCFNEALVLAETARRLETLLQNLARDGRIAAGSRVYFIDDGSTDQTWTIVCDLRAQSSWLGGIKLSRNRGHQNALMAGLLTAPGDLIVSVDADLQDDLDAIGAMLAEAAGGADIVCGVRSARTTDSAAKRLTAHAYYYLLRLLRVDIVFDHADFRLMSRRAVEALREYSETNLFLRALIPQLGYKTSIVTYARGERFAGESKYSVPKMFALAFEGLTSFSTTPLRLVTILGLLTSLFSLCITIWALVTALILHAAIPGWASTVIPIYLVCGVQLLSVGVLGEYVGKIYLETKRRPRFHIEEVCEPAAIFATPPAVIVTPCEMPRMDAQHEIPTQPATLTGPSNNPSNVQTDAVTPAVLR
jgi:glycosyltransferase involved in cell wall biosynthesis